MPETDRTEPFRILVVTADEHVSEALQDEIRRRADGRSVETKVIAPVFGGSRLDHAMGSVDHARPEAEKVVEGAQADLEGTDEASEVVIGDSDPMQAIEDALLTFDADEILLVTHDEEHSSWTEDQTFDEARRRFPQPISHYTVGTDGRVAGREESDPGKDLEDMELEGGAYRRRGFSLRDIAGIVVAIVGTIVLVVLAADCNSTTLNEQGGSDTACVIRTMLAGAFGLINIAHIVGLFIFQATGYRGFWEKFFAMTSLFGTTAAILISALISPS